MNIPIADLHCDLLSYLAFKPERGVHDPESRCSLTQLKEGNVFLQVLAVFTETSKKSVSFAEKQFLKYQQILQLHPNEFERLHDVKMPIADGRLHVLLAIENASGLCDESEELENGFTRYGQYSQIVGPILYVSLTWNQENRFGGGNFSKVGLKRDGELFLEYLSKKNVLIDLSHSSDPLAHDILNYIDKKGLKLIPIASHSNFRKITDQARNLPDDIAKEIFKRGGIVGLNFVKKFVGPHLPEDFTRHVDYARSLGGLNQLCFGADFFCDHDLLFALQPLVPFFHPDFGNASCYPKVIQQLSEVFTTQELENIAYKNFAQFLERRGKAYDDFR